jgi:hypothetical protein
MWQYGLYGFTERPMQSLHTGLKLNNFVKQSTYREADSNPIN